MLPNRGWTRRSSAGSDSNKPAAMSKTASAPGSNRGRISENFRESIQRTFYDGRPRSESPGMRRGLLNRFREVGRIRVRWIAAAPVGLMQGEVGDRNQPVETNFGFAPRQRGESETRLKRLWLMPESSAELVPYPIGQRRCFRFRRARQYHPELFSAPSAQQVVRRQILLQDDCGKSQRRIDGEMAVVAIDLFQRIQVDHDDAQRQTFASVASQFSGSSVAECPAMEKPGEMIVRGHVFEPGVGFS